MSLPDLNYKYVPTPPGVRQRNSGVGSITWTAESYLNKYPLVKRSIETGLQASTEKLRTTSALFFCPKTAEFPTEASSGYYTGGSADRMTQTHQTRCEPGYYCKSGIRYPCPPGYFGSSSGLTEPTCDGFCPAGFACSQGTVNPSACPLGHYSVAGSSRCSECPIPSMPSCTTSRECCQQQWL